MTSGIEDTVSLFLWSEHLSASFLYPPSSSWNKWSHKARDLSLARDEGVSVHKETVKECRITYTLEELFLASSNPVHVKFLHFDEIQLLPE